MDTRPTRWIGLIPAAAAFGCMTVWTWRKWPDALVDFGLQLYAPWQLATGQWLYRDVKYLSGGPLSQYFDAALFRMFGVSLATLIISNLVLLSVLIVVLYRAFERASDWVTSTVICLVVLLVFSFSEYVEVGNYNYICPYTHEAFHGLLLSVFSLVLLARWLRSGGTGSAAAAGFCFGLVFMTKPDVFLALAAAAAGAFALAAMTNSAGRPSVFGAVSVFFLSAAVPVLAVFLCFRNVADAETSLRWVAGAWLPLLTTPAARNDFYRWSLGLDAPERNTLLMLAHAGGIGLVVALYAWCCRGFWQRALAERAALGALMAALMVAAYFYTWLDCGRALPVLGVVSVGVTWLCWHLRDSPIREEDPTFPVLWSVFGLFLLAKMGLNGRIWHYGFYLAMPAATAFIFLLCGVLPRMTQPTLADHALFRAVLFGTLAIGTYRLVGTSAGIYRMKDYPVGRGPDRILAYRPEADERSSAMSLTLGWLNSNTPPRATMAVLPEGVMLNYLSRRANPTPYAGFTLPEVQAYGEANMLEAYKKNSPDYIVLVHRDSSEYGVGLFGQTPEYGLSVMRWIKQQYDPVFLIGYAPLQTNLFGIQIFKRK